MRRPAFTLLELLIAATLVVVLSAVAAPSLAALLGRQDVMTAAGDVARFLDENRRRAVEEGVPRWVRLESGGPEMLAGPEGGPGDHDPRLSDPCRFAPFDPSERLSGVAQENAIHEQVDADWSPAIVFRPDGSSGDLAFAIEDDRGRRRDFVLRGLTGRLSAAETSQ